MYLFLLTFFLLYGGLHLYFFLRIRAAFAPGSAVQVALVALLVLGLVAPIIVRVAERYGIEILVRLLSWAGYLWMGLLFLFFTSSLLVDIYRLLVHLAGLIFLADLGRFAPQARTLFVLPLAVALIAGCYGFFEARQIRSERIEIRSAKIPKETGRIRIVQISDVHIGVLVRNERLAGMLRKVREAAPDILVSTGDLVDGQLDRMAEAAEQLNRIRPRYGKFAVTGNHEFIAGIDAAIDFTTRAGFVLLRGRSVTLAGAVDLAGVDDPAVHRFTIPGSAPVRQVPPAGDGRFTVLLKHQPLIEKGSPGTFDLQLSGHTHRGQIYPFRLVTRLFYPYHSGDFRLEDNALLHVSRGTGTWGPPIRFLSPPEITIIDLIPE
jgi:uncharacterized protein